jgi:hypothetical protein
MVSAVVIAIDLFAISIMTFGIYFPPHRRRNFVVAFLGVNVGVLAVATMLGPRSSASACGLGLFGVLSIIRLRSSEISWTEVAYYFAYLALGLMAGLSVTINPLVIALMALSVPALLVCYDPYLFKHYRQTVQLDTAYADETKLRLELERRRDSWPQTMLSSATSSGASDEPPRSHLARRAHRRRRAAGPGRPQVRRAGARGRCRGRKIGCDDARS